AAPPMRANALAVLSRVLLARGETANALEASAEAMMQVQSGGFVEEGEVLIPLAHGEALQAAGKTAEARKGFAEGHRRLMMRAAFIGDAGATESYLRRVPEHARLIELVADGAG